MGTADCDPYVQLPQPLRLPFLEGLRASELAKKADWFIESGTTSWRRDAAAHQGGDEVTVRLYEETDPLVCLIPNVPRRQRTEDQGMPHRLAAWILRRRAAQAALPQQSMAAVRMRHA